MILTERYQIVVIESLVEGFDDRCDMMYFEIAICELIERVIFSGDTDLTQIMIALFDRRSFLLPG